MKTKLVRFTVSSGYVGTELEEEYEIPDNEEFEATCEGILRDMERDYIYDSYFEVVE